MKEAVNETLPNPTTASDLLPPSPVLRHYKSAWTTSHGNACRNGFLEKNRNAYSNPSARPKSGSISGPDLATLTPCFPVNYVRIEESPELFVKLMDPYQPLAARSSRLAAL